MGSPEWITTSAAARRAGLTTSTSVLVAVRKGKIRKRERIAGLPSRGYLVHAGDVAKWVDSRALHQPAKHVDVRTAALMLGLSPIGVASAIKAGRIAAVKAKGQRQQVWYIPEREVARYLNAPDRPRPAKWDEGMDAGLLELIGSCTAAQIASYMGVTENQVHARLAYLKRRGIYDGVGRSRKMSPFVMTKSCILIAKSCVKCGKLRGARYYARKLDKKTGQRPYSSICRLCHTDSCRDLPSRERAAENRELLQEISYGLATNHQAPYTAADDDVLRDRSISDFDAAIKLGRTYVAVLARRNKIGAVNRVPRLRDEYWRWQIKLPESHVAVHRHFQRIGKPVPEEIWGIDDGWKDEVA